MNVVYHISRIRASAVSLSHDGRRARRVTGLSRHTTSRGRGGAAGSLWHLRSTLESAVIRRTRLYAMRGPTLAWWIRGWRRLTRVRGVTRARGSFTGSSRQTLSSGGRGVLSVFSFFRGSFVVKFSLSATEAARAASFPVPPAPWLSQ